MFNFIDCNNINYHNFYNFTKIITAIIINFIDYSNLIIIFIIIICTLAQSLVFLNNNALLFHNLKLVESHEDNYNVK